MIKYILLIIASLFLIGCQPECYEDTLQHVDYVFHVQFDEVNKLRCEGGFGGWPYFQYEVEGTDKEGNSYYIHYHGAGIAASGQDHFKDECMIVNGEKVISVLESGLTSKSDNASCKYVPRK